MTTRRVTLIANPSTPLPEELAGAEVEVLEGPQTIMIQGTPHSWYYVCAQLNADGSHTPCHLTCAGPHYQGFMRLEDAPFTLYASARDAEGREVTQRVELSPAFISRALDRLLAHEALQQRLREGTEAEIQELLTVGGWDPQTAEDVEEGAKHMAALGIHSKVTVGYGPQEVSGPYVGSQRVRLLFHRPVMIDPDKLWVKP